MGRSAWSALAVSAALALATCAAAQQTSPAAKQAGDVAAGAALFSGTLRFTRGGPACLACHRANGLPFPNGGTLGPDLSQAYTRMGAPGIDSALTTLFFPAMYPLYRTRPLTAQERADVAAFLQSAASQPQASSAGEIAGLSVILFVIFMLIIAFAGRHRLTGVRRRLVESARARAAGGEPS